MDPTERLDGKAALITGASRGIGRATAEALASNGVDVALLARSESRLESIAASIESEFAVDTEVCVADVTNPTEVRSEVQRSVASFGDLDILVNNAGIDTAGYDDRFEEASLEVCERIIQTNLTGSVNVTHAALPSIRANQGNIIFVGSSAAMRPRPGAMIYAASKWGLRGFALSLEAHAGQDGIGVSIIHTSLVRTERWHDVPRGEAAEPDELARAIIFAASQAPHTTISELTVHRRDILGKFVPEEVDLDLAFDHPEHAQG